jgi:hypothetical protein
MQMEWRLGYKERIIPCAVDAFEGSIRNQHESQSWFKYAPLCGEFRDLEQGPWLGPLCWREAAEPVCRYS